MTNMIIAFYGLPRSGKDTAAEHLAKHHQLHRVSFGAGIYEEVAKAFGVTVEQLASHEWKTEPQHALRLNACDSGEFLDAVCRAEGPITEYDVAEKFMLQPRTSRYILQRWATEYRRAQDPLYWVKKLDNELKRKIAKDGLRDIVVSDLREFHEYHYLNTLASELYTNLRVIEVEREGTVSNGHSSDNALPKWVVNERIVNVDIDKFRQEVERVVDNLRKPVTAKA